MPRFRGPAGRKVQTDLDLDLACWALDRFLPRRGGRLQRTAAKSRAISCLVRATANPLFLGCCGSVSGGGGAEAGEWSACPAPASVDLDAGCVAG